MTYFGSSLLFLSLHLELNLMLPIEFISLAIILRLASGAQYTWSVIVGKSRPNPITWFFWGITALITFFAQLSEGLGAFSLISLALAIGPLTVSVIATLKGHLRAHLNRFNFICMTITIIGIILWRLTDNADIAIVFSIIADATISLPTLTKGFKDPKSEYVIPYFLSASSMIITLFTIQSWTFTAFGFPLYMLLINLTLFSTPLLGELNLRLKSNKTRKQRSQKARQ